MDSERSVTLSRQLAEETLGIVQWAFNNYHWRKDGELAEALRAAIAVSSGAEVSIDLRTVEAAKECVMQVFTNRRSASDGAVLAALSEAVKPPGSVVQRP